MKNIKILLMVFVVLIIQRTEAQISPPGLGKAASASWLALGLKQKLDSTGSRSATSYIGLGAVSDPQGDNNPFKKQSILVLNHERYHLFDPHWQYSYALSYRRQNSFDSKATYQKEGTEQEFRLYGRISYLKSLGDFRWKNTWRQEFRKFFTPDFTAAEENLQLRTRLKSQLDYKFGDYDQKFILGGEALFASSLMNYPNSSWKSLRYKESRFTFYYSRSLFNLPLTADLGYMLNLIDSPNAPVSVHYLALDLIWNLQYHKY